MQVSVNGKQLDIGQALRERAERELAAVVEKYFDHASSAQVTFTRESGLFRADVQIHLFNRVVMQAHGTGGEAAAAFEEALDHAAKRLRRYKRRLKAHREKPRSQEAPLAAQQYVLRPHDDEDTTKNLVTETPEGDDQPIIIADMMTEIETLSVGEAAMRMDLAHLPAMLFRNAAHGRLNMVYQRPDGNIGWVDPETPSAKPGARD